MIRSSLVNAVAVLIATLLAPLTASADCDWGDGTSTPQSVFAQSCREQGGVPNGCSCNPAGGTYHYTPPDPKVMALQRANQRMNDLLWRWKNDFQFLSIDDWQNMDRSSEAAFLEVAERLDRAFIDQLNHFMDDEAIDAAKFASVAASDRVIKSYRYNIAVFDRYLTTYEPSFMAAQKEIARLTAEIQTFHSLEEQYLLKTARDRLLAVEALSVYLPKRAVRLHTDTVARYDGMAAAHHDGEVFPFQWKPAVRLPTYPSERELDRAYLDPAPAAASPAQYRYSVLPQSPEDAVAILEADERRAARAFRERNDYDKSHPEIFDLDRKEAEVARLRSLQTAKAARLAEIANMDEQKGVFPRRNALREEAGVALAGLLNRAAESLVWELAKGAVVDKCKKAVADTSHARLARLYLSDIEIHDKYEGHLFNVFSAPETVFKVKDLKAVQNDILTLLKHDQNYAKTAVRLAATGDPSEIKAFVDGMFSKLDEDGTKLVDDAFSASLSIPEPGRTLLSRYFTKSFRDKRAEAE